MEHIGFAEAVAALILYGIFYFSITKFSNVISNKKIQKDVFGLGNQLFFWIGCILFLVFINIKDHDTLSSILKISMGILLILDIVFYFFLKFSEYPFMWAIWSIILDLLAIPAGILLILIAFGVAYGNTYGRCYWWCNDDKN